MAKQSTATEAVTREPAQARTAPTISPLAVHLNYAGAVIREFVVRLPHEFTNDDLMDPNIWQKVQGNRDVALVKGDRLLLLTYDEATMFVAYVAHATMTGASLSKPQIVTLHARQPSQFADENYEIEWRGSGYAVIRKKDRHVMSAGHQGEANAIQALLQLYARKVA
jgi:hypothetical protein